MKLKFFTILIFVAVSIKAICQEKQFQDKWLLILSAHNTHENAEKASKMFNFRSYVINSSDYDNLNPGIFIVAIPFDNKEAALEKSGELKGKRISNYVKFAGKAIVEEGNFEDHVKFVINNRFVVFEQLYHHLSGDGRNHELLAQGTPVDVLSDVKSEEISSIALNWKDKPFYLLNASGNMVSDQVKISKFHILSRVRIETYRPPWCFDYDDPSECMSGNYSDETVISYVWKNGTHLLVGEIETDGGVLAIKSKAYIPDLYEEIDPFAVIGEEDKFVESLKEAKEIQDIYENTVPESEREGINKWTESKDSYMNCKAFTYKGDTLVYISFGICDSPCGGYIEEYRDLAWRIKNGKYSPIQEINAGFNQIFHFNINNMNMIFKFNHNKSLLQDTDSYFYIDLPFEFEDPWEC